jgi:hypothetical protein
MGWLILYVYIVLTYDCSNPLYVSPSDNIMSPASQKLSSFKQRQINKYVPAIGKRNQQANDQLAYPLR